MLQDKKRTKPAMARIDFHPTFFPCSGTTYAYAFVTHSSTLKSWRKQCLVFDQKANPVFLTAENLFIFSLSHFKLKNARNSNSKLTES